MCGLWQSFKSVEKSAEMCILWFLFFTYTVEGTQSEYLTFERTPKFSSCSNSLFIGPKTTNGTFLLDLKIGFTFSLISNFTFIFVYLSSPSENTSGNLFFKFSATLFVLVRETSILWQKEFMGSYHKLNKTIQSVPNRLEVLIQKSILSMILCSQIIAKRYN